MARRGGFGASLNPLGTGSFGNFAQYQIGDDLADLKRYEAEVAWSNGQLSDAEYLKVLGEAVAAASPDSRAKIAAQNKLDDATYRIGRADAEQFGPDALIAFDTAALGSMNPGNLRYSDVKQTLDSELAQRRSKDYGALVQAYNAGTATTQDLLAWVRATSGSIPADAPDAANWKQTGDELTRKVQDEADSAAYQDYQMGRLKPDQFLAYLTTRRDSYTVGSPQFNDWTRRVEDATTQVTNAKLSAQDAVFFNAYNEGHKSDTQYLAYLRGRIAAMPADDPNRAEWDHRYKTAAFSLAEDALRFDVGHGKRPVSALVSFYEAYRRGLNSGSAEWRSVTDRLDAARKYKSGGGGGGGTSSGYGKYDPTKAIDPKASLHTILHQITLTPNSSDAMVRNYHLNATDLTNAYQRGDRTWLFHDPANPGAVTQMRDGQGNVVKGKDGKPVMVRGSFYLSVTDDAYTGVLGIEVNFKNALAERALGKGALGGAHGYYAYAAQANDALDKLRGADIHASVRRLETDLDAKQKELDHFKTIGDKAGVLNATNDMGLMVNALLSDPLMDESRRTRFEDLRTRLADNPLVPKFDPQTGQLIGGAVDLQNSARDASGKWLSVALAPGWHDVFDTSPATGESTIKQVFDDLPPGVWQSTHATVTTRFGERVVTAEAPRTNAPVVSQMLVHMPGKDILVDGPPGSSAITYFDDQGKHTAYSFDGQTFIRSDAGGQPMTELPVALVQSKPAPDGTVTWLDAQGNEVLKIRPDGTPDVPDMSLVKWYGQSAVEARLASLPGRHLGAERNEPGMLDVGAPGQQLTLAKMGAGGLNMLPPSNPVGVGFGVGQARANVRAVPTMGAEDIAHDAANAASGLIARQAQEAFWNSLVTQLPPSIGSTYMGLGIASSLPPRYVPHTSPPPLRNTVGAKAEGGADTIYTPPQPALPKPPPPPTLTRPRAF